MLLLIFYVVIALGFSFLCSIAEAVILSVTKCGGKSSMRFALALNNAMHQDGALTTVQLIENPAVHDFVWQAEAGRHIDVMGGLLNFNVQQSNTLPNGDASPDDYDVQVEITIEGWSSW